MEEHLFSKIFCFSLFFYYYFLFLSFFFEKKKKKNEKCYGQLYCRKRENPNVGIN